ncbi:NBS-LRR type resistance protein [Cucumis melo var. makuwa]|uniref:NBS-LRR type resistance protein n=1 Tax=Cucumis melo var. makuwa TaxID=1194695 RepID=A0A5D3CDZ0_CUCMM|nr:NBS-LRR type resistance protein [Cucumis melo var. makuwa]TYK09745.1 NBS-LRR type resistance protein [Cucumis melo var. makuwa]
MAFTCPSCLSSVCPSLCPYLKSLRREKGEYKHTQTHISVHAPEGCTYQSSAPEGCTYQSSAPEGCSYQSSALEGCTYQSSALEGCTYQSSAPAGCTIRKVHYPIDEANRYPSVHTKPSTTVIPH